MMIGTMMEHEWIAVAILWLIFGTISFLIHSDFLRKYMSMKIDNHMSLSVYNLIFYHF